ncbi:MAG: LPXTG cell wall anchor domain-containing protein [Chloroflexia bacterium]|nr:LPXTG cell wall anchor domain-containing protein [Chloroflexia bacterium]
MRRFSALLKLAMLTALVGGLMGATAPQAFAAHGGPNIEIHKAECDSASTALFDDCHEDVVAGVTFSIDNPNTVADGTLVTDANGEATFAVAVGATSSTVTEFADDVDSYDGLYVFCQEVTSATDETPVGDVKFDGRADTGVFTIAISGTEYVICDVYNLFDAAPTTPAATAAATTAPVATTAPTGGTTTLPSTGAGTSGSSNNASFFLAFGVVALGLGAYALRRRTA